MEQSQPKKTYLRLFSPDFLQLLILYSVSFALLAVILFATSSFAGNDDYYHMGMGLQIAEQKRLAIDFPWLPLTILSPDKFVDHHLLYHLYLAPFVHFGGITGAKLAQIAIAAGVVVAIWWVLRQIGVRWATLWSLGFFALSAPFLHRMLMIRTQGAALLLIVVAIGLLLEKRYLFLLPLGFAYAWLFDGFILLPAVSVIYLISVWLAENRLEWRPVAYALAGVALGLVINPYFPRNLEFIIEHLGAKVGFESGIPVGNEWYPYSTGDLLRNSPGALIALFVGFLRPSFGEHKRDTAENTLMFVALLTLFMLFQSRRFIEYYPAFALLFCAAAWGRGTIDVLARIPRRAVALAISAVLTIVVIAASMTIAYTRSILVEADDPLQFAGASNWLRRNTAEGSMVFQTDWDDFTRLFYYNPSNIYIVGLDPTYLELADPEMWDEWVAITRGEVEVPSAKIRDDFDAGYVVSDRRHAAFKDQADADPQMKLVYWDSGSYVWQIISQD